MEKNLKIPPLKSFVVKMGLTITSRLLELLNKMVLQRERIGPLKRWQEPCYVKTTCLITSGLKQLAQVLML